MPQPRRRQRPTRANASLLIGVGAITGPGGVHADFIITDPSFFDGKPHTLIDFETDAAGNSWNLGPGDAGAVPLNAYVPLGVFFGASTTGLVGRPLDNTDLSQAILLGGSPVTILGFETNGGDDPLLGFFGSMHAISFSVFFDTALGGARPSLRFLGPNGVLLREIAFESALVEGSVGSVEFGTVGFASDERIVSVQFDLETTAVYDNLRVSSVPSPGALAIMLGGLFAAGRRRLR